MLHAETRVCKKGTSSLPSRRPPLRRVSRGSTTWDGEGAVVCESAAPPGSGRGCWLVCRGVHPLTRLPTKPHVTPRITAALAKLCERSRQGSPGCGRGSVGARWRPRRGHRGHHVCVSGACVPGRWGTPHSRRQFDTAGWWPTYSVVIAAQTRRQSRRVAARDEPGFPSGSREGGPFHSPRAVVCGPARPPRPPPAGKRRARSIRRGFLTGAF